MTGKELKNRLRLSGKRQNEIAYLLGVTPQSLTSSLLVKNVSSIMLERLCDVLGVKMNFFYEGTKYGIVLPDSNLEGAKFEDLEKENIYIKGKLEGYKEALSIMGCGEDPKKGKRRKVT